MSIRPFARSGRASRFGKIFSRVTSPVPTSPLHAWHWASNWMNEQMAKKSRPRRTRSQTRWQLATETGMSMESLEPRIMLSLTVGADLNDYSPGDTALITASGLTPGETAEFQVLHVDETPNTGAGHAAWQVVDGGADDLDGAANGAVQTSWQLANDDSLDSVFEVTATGLTSGETGNAWISGAAEQVQSILTVTTDNADYLPGDMVEITASGLTAGETAEFQVLHIGTPNNGAGHDPWQVVDGSADDLDGVADGTVRTNWLISQDDNPGSAFEVSVTGLTSEKTGDASFTDSHPQNVSAITVTTDKDDYLPLEEAVITASGLGVGETAEFHVYHIDGTPNTGDGHGAWQVVDGSADDLDGVADGTIQTTWLVTEDDSLGSTFEVTATGLTSGETGVASFTDFHTFSRARLYVFDTSVIEGDSATTSMRFIVRNIGNRTGFFRYSTFDGSATLADGDYLQLSNIFRSVGRLSSTIITVAVRGDTNVEPNETLGVSLTRSSLTTLIFRANGIGTIINDDFNNPPVVNDQSFDVVENETSVGTVAASDPDAGDTITYAITGGADAGLFDIDTSTGALSFINAPDFETPLDDGGDNVYDLEITVSDDDGESDSANMQVNVLNQASITGSVFVDVDGDGEYDANEPGIDGVVVELLDDMGNAVLDGNNDPITAITSDGGYFLFEDLDPATYQIHEVQPTGVDDGAEILGTGGGAIISDDTMELSLARDDVSDYAFAELGQELTSGDTATIGFWQNKHGQALIKQGGTALATWLTDNFGNVFGNEFDVGVGDDGAEVAEFYKLQLFKKKAQKSAGPAKVDAQFMATALATFYTSNYLAGNVAASFGFNVSDTGIGTNIVNVGSNGAAFDVADGTDMTIMQLLLATNALTDQPDNNSGASNVYDLDGDGTIDSYEASLRSMANSIYSMINEAGD